MAYEATKKLVLPLHELVKWLHDQPNTWWSVDGDPLLSGRISFPCPADELADELQRIGKDLVLILPDETVTPPGAAMPKILDQVSRSPADFDGDRLLAFGWANAREALPWFLLEDTRAAAIHSGAA
jgi:hypothetical protein